MDLVTFNFQVIYTLTVGGEISGAPGQADNRVCGPA